jgi:drug/metabolite transporter (DMT)-like permease
LGVDPHAPPATLSIRLNCASDDVPTFLLQAPAVSRVPRPSLASTLLMWLALVGFDTMFQLVLKTAGGTLDAPSASLDWLLQAAGEWRVWLAAAAYIAQFGLWMLILRRSSLSFAFPITALTYVSVLLGSHWLLGEQISLLRWAGVALIICGLALLRDDATAAAPSVP